MHGLATVITTHLLRISPNSQLSRYTQLFMTFFISGFIHALTEIAQGMDFWQSGAIRFFVTQALGILLEDIIRAQWSLIRSSRKERSISTTSVRTLPWLGYLWVFLFMVWSTPVWIYPAIAANRGEEKDLILPFSIVGTIHGLVSPA